MEIKSPPGYGTITVLDKEKHRGLGINEDSRKTIGAELNAIYITLTEFFKAVHYYPIVFGLETETGEYLPLAVTGLAAGQNLFTDNEGQWIEDVYLPAYIRRYPFCTAEVHNSDTNTKQTIICVDENGLSNDAPALFDDEGNPTEEWQKTETFINDMEEATKQTRRLTRALKQLDLLEPFEAHAHPKVGQPLRLQGLYRVNEDRLNKLSGSLIKDFMSRGELSRIYTHLMSLENFAQLLDMNLSQENTLNIRATP